MVQYNVAQKNDSFHNIFPFTRMNIVYILHFNQCKDGLLRYLSSTKQHLGPLYGPRYAFFLPLAIIVKCYSPWSYPLLLIQKFPPYSRGRMLGPPIPFSLIVANSMFSRGRTAASIIVEDLVGVLQNSIDNSDLPASVGNARARGVAHEGRPEDDCQILRAHARGFRVLHHAEQV